MLDAAVAHLRKSSAPEWVSWRGAEGLQAGAIFSAAFYVAQSEVPNKTERMINTGMAEAATAVAGSFCSSSSLSSLPQVLM